LSVAQIGKFVEVFKSVTRTTSAATAAAAAAAANTFGVRLTSLFFGVHPRLDWVFQGLQKENLW